MAKVHSLKVFNLETLQNQTESIYASKVPHKKKKSYINYCCLKISDFNLRAEISKLHFNSGIWASLTDVLIRFRNPAARFINVKMLKS